jgi:uncharacterized protein YraI
VGVKAAEHGQGIASLALAVLMVAGTAGAASLTDRARLREGPGKDTPLLGWVEPGTQVTIEGGDHGGWYRVRTADDRTGYVFRDHLGLDGSTPPQPAPATPPPSVATIATLAATPPPADDATPPQPEADAARERTDAPAAGDADLERLRAEVARLAAVQQELVERLKREGLPARADAGSETSAGPAAVFLLAGALMGWGASRFFRGRRDRRQRIRL